MAAKALEAAATLSTQQLNNHNEAARLYDIASSYYRAHSSIEKAAEMLTKGAKYVGLLLLLLLGK